MTMIRQETPARSDVVRLLAQMVEIDSTNPSLVKGAPGEEALARFLARRLTAAGLEVDLWEPLPGRPNVVATLRGTGGGRSLMLCGHLDVVGATPEAFRAVIQDDRMNGRGTIDMKAGLAAAAVTLERLAAAPDRLRGDVVFAGVIDEEWASAGAEDLTRRHRADAAILAERSDLDVVTAHGGFVWYEIESRGVEAAGVEQERGVDAISLLGPLLSGIAELDRELSRRPRAAYGRGSIHASTIVGGDQLPVYPARCVLGVERCLIGTETVAQADAEMEQLLAAARAADPRFDGRLTKVIAREAVELDPGGPVVDALTTAAETTLGHAVTVRGDLGWMDSGLLVEAGIPCVSFGPLGGGEHTAEEWVDLASVEVCTDVLERAARAFCA